MMTYTTSRLDCLAQIFYSLAFGVRPTRRYRFEFGNGEMGMQEERGK
jgi:hypothetical protein